MQLASIRAYRIYQRPKAFMEGFVPNVGTPTPPYSPLAQRRFKQLTLNPTLAQLSLFVDRPSKHSLAT